jgi:acetyltransferase-like isoleucine patch superfamily enzyme
MRREGLRGVWVRILQVVALYVPGARTWRPRIHRWRGVHVGHGCFIGQDTMIETSRPHQIYIGDRVGIGARVTIVAHFRGITPADRTGDDRAISVRIEDEAFIGPGVIILPNVTVGRGAVVTAGSVLTHSVPPMTMVQGNPAKPIARCGIPLTEGTTPKQFYSKLRLIR